MLKCAEIDILDERIIYYENVDRTYHTQDFRCFKVKDYDFIWFEVLSFFLQIIMMVWYLCQYD